MSNQNQNDNLNLLDETLDDLADLPESKPYPAGAHIATMFVSRGKNPGAYVVKFKHVSTLELANPSDSSPKPNDEAVVFLSTKKKDGTANSIGQGQLKQILLPLSGLFNTASVGEILEQGKAGVEVMIVTDVRKQAEYPDSMTVKKISLV